MRLNGYSYLFPTYWKKFLSGEKKRKPLFPGYVFVYVRLKDSYHKIKYTRGVTRFVGFGGLPLPVPANVINILRERILKDGTVKMGSYSFRKGEAVKVMKGPFGGLEGIFIESLNCGERIALLIKGLHSARLEVDKSAVAVVM